MFNYLQNTKQIKRKGRKWEFTLKKSAGARLANRLNDLKPFESVDLKRLALSEYLSTSRELTREAMQGLGLKKPVGLRNALSNQMKISKKIMKKPSSMKTPKKDQEFDDEGGDEGDEY